MRNVLIIKHVVFEGPGKFSGIFNQLGYTIQTCNAWEIDFDKVNEFDILLLMGGSMSASDEISNPWLVKEKAFVKKAIDSKKTVIGVCLGAQIIASALGEPVFLADEKEIGWYPVCWKERDYNFVLHWHGETFDLPEGAELIASSAVCKNQIFSYKKHVLALQCHLEMDEPGLKAIIENCGEELTDERFVMSEQQLLEGYSLYAETAFEKLSQLVLPFIKPKKLRSSRVL